MKPKCIKIGKYLVGENYPCYIIAEIGSNFDNKISTAKKLIKLAKDCGATAAKFQSFKTEELLSKKGFEDKSEFQSKWKKTVWDTYRDAELPRNWHSELFDYAKKIGIDFFTSPWDFEAVDILKTLNVPAIKIGSGDITYSEILTKIGKINKPIILATGASTIKEISQAIKTIQATRNNKIILLHSVVQYPSPIEEANILALDTLRSKFNLNVGYSDHSLGSLVVLASVARGACVIEKHFTTDSKLNGPDHPHSMNPKEFKEMILNIRLLEKALGNGKKSFTKSETNTRIIQRRGIWSIKEIKCGDIFTRDNIKVLRPAHGLHPSKFLYLLGKRSKRDYQVYQPI